MPQVTPVLEEFVFGSAKVEIGDSVEALTSLGAGDSIKAVESFDPIKMDIDNGGEVILGIKNHKLVVSGTFYQLNIERIAAIRGGIDILTNIAGTLVSGATQTVIAGNWGFNKFIELQGQNADGTAQTISSVVGSIDGAASADDYDLAEVNGRWGIVPRDGTAFVTESQSLTVTYSYTPTASRKFTTGGKKTIDPKVVRVTHTNSAGEKLQITAFKGKNTNGLTFEFPSDNADKAMGTPFEFECTLDSDRAVGAQLFELIDERTY